MTPAQPRGRLEAGNPVEAENDIVGDQLAAVHRGLVVPVNAPADVEGKSEAVRGDFEALGKVGSKDI